jgi:hypothetical protein
LRRRAAPAFGRRPFAKPHHHGTSRPPGRPAGAAYGRHGLRGIPYNRWVPQIHALLSAALSLRDRRNAGHLSEHGLGQGGRCLARLEHLLITRALPPAIQLFAIHLAVEFPAVFTFLFGIRPSTRPTALETDSLNQPLSSNPFLCDGFIHDYTPVCPGARHGVLIVPRPFAPSDTRPVYSTTLRLAGIGATADTPCRWIFEARTSTGLRADLAFSVRRWHRRRDTRGPRNASCPSRAWRGQEGHVNLEEIEHKLMDLDHRVDRIEQIPPTLLTREEFKTAMEKVATKEDLREAVDGLHTETKAELEALRSEVQIGFVKHSSEIRRHFDVVAESLRGDIRLIADGHSYVLGRLDRIDQRLDAIERQPSRPR